MSDLIERLRKAAAFRQALHGAGDPLTGPLLEEAASALSQAEGAQDERALFEEWAHKDSRRLEPQEFEDPTPDNNHYYLIDSTNEAYIGWCARAALPTRPREQEGAEPVASGIDPNALSSVRDLVRLIRELRDIDPDTNRDESEDCELQVFAKAEQVATYLAHPLPAASFQAGAEAMREACLAAADDERLEALDRDAEDLAYNRAIDHVVDALGALPIPASSEGR